MSQNYPLGVTAVMLPELDFPEQLALCRELGVTHYQWRPRVIAEGMRNQPYSNWGNHKFDLTPERLRREAGTLRKMLAEAGMVSWGTVPAATTDLTDEQLRLHLEGAAAVGAGRVRIGPMGYPREPFAYGEFVSKLVERYGRIVAMARGLGVKVVLETHAGSVATSPGLAYNLVRHFDPQDVGVIFDLPNFAREGMVQANLAVSVLGPWIDHCHVGGSRRVTRGEDAQGFRMVENEFCALSQSDLHFPTWLHVLRQAGVAVPLVIEDYTAGLAGAERLRRTVAEVRRALAGLPA